MALQGGYMNHIELNRLFELAQMAAIGVDQPERDHFRNFGGCSVTFLELRDMLVDGCLTHLQPSTLQ
jgi:hypothetical protein